MIKREYTTIRILELQQVIHVVERELPHGDQMDGSYCASIELILEGDRPVHLFNRSRPRLIA